MNASLARRIRNAEAVLISALDRRKNGQRDSGRQYGLPQPTVIISGRPLKQDGSRATCSHLNLSRLIRSGSAWEGEREWNPTEQRRGVVPLRFPRLH